MRAGDLALATVWRDRSAALALPQQWRKLLHRPNCSRGGDLVCTEIEDATGYDKIAAIVTSENVATFC